MKLRQAAIAVATIATVSAVTPAAARAALTVTNPLVADFPSVTLDGTAQAVTASLDAFTVTDTSLVSAGWHVTVQATRFAEHDGSAYVAAGKLLPAASLTMPAPEVTSSGTFLPAISTGSPWAIDVASPVTIASAAGIDAGTYTFSSVLLSLSIPPTAYARTYRSEVTVSVVSGP